MRPRPPERCSHASHDGPILSTLAGRRDQSSSVDPPQEPDQRLGWILGWILEWTGAEGSWRTAQQVAVSVSGSSGGSRCSPTGQTQLANPSCSAWSPDRGSPANVHKGSAALTYLCQLPRSRRSRRRLRELRLSGSPSAAVQPPAQVMLREQKVLPHHVIDARVAAVCGLKVEKLQRQLF